MIDDPRDFYTPTRREAVAWIAVAVVTLAGRYIARQLAARRPVWAVLAFAFAVGAGVLAVRGQHVSNPYTFGPSRVEAASEAATPTANPLLQRGYVTPMPGGETAVHDDPMVPLLPMMDTAAPGGPDDGTPPGWLPAGLAPWWLAIVAAAHEHGLDSHAWGAIVSQECPTGDAACYSQAGAQGLAQLMPATARDIEAATGLDTSTPDGNLRGGAWYFSQRVRDNGDLWRTDADDEAVLLAAAAAYNGGALPSQDVRQAALAGAGDVCAGVRYAETRVYCEAFRGRWRATLAERATSKEAMR